ncbi:MAG: MBL fold metallo-hydrolase [bacterium]|nr:MBL fold metallo-hydrolase [bacterium]
MPDLLGLSARFIDEGIYEGPGSVNRTTAELSEVADQIAVVEAFSHVVAFDTGEGLVLFDTSLEAFAEGILKSLRSWSEAPIHTIAYTHGHVDHVGGTQRMIEEGRRAGHGQPRIVGHENLPDRFERYQFTNGYNGVINARQFGRVRTLGGMVAAETVQSFGPSTWVRPDTTFRDRLRLQVGELDMEFRHARGETDDHLWAWIPSRKAICAGDFITWVFPNAGNPQKVQRFPLEWAKALREMSALGAELLLPAHGLPVAGETRIRGMLDDIARALEILVEQTLELMNGGARLDQIVHEVKLPDELLQKPYLRPVYDEPEFVLHNIWRLYGGWYDGNPAHLKPAPAQVLSNEIAQLAGGIDVLIQRAQDLAEASEFRLACELIEMATLATPSDRSAHAARAEIYAARRRGELSLMAKGIYGHAARESESLAKD